MSVNDCVSYALENRQLVNQSKLDEQINERTIKANLAAWLPQVRMEYNLSHYFKLPVSLFPNQNNPNGARQPIKIGVANTSNALFQVDQTLLIVMYS